VAPSTEILAKKMGGLLKRGELTDVVLVTSDGRELAAHRAVLGAHSQVKYWILDAKYEQ
jgi:hypothetical protein